MASPHPVHPRPLFQGKALGVLPPLHETSGHWPWGVMGGMGQPRLRPHTLYGLRPVDRFCFILVTIKIISGYKKKMVKIVNFECILPQ